MILFFCEKLIDMFAHIFDDITIFKNKFNEFCQNNNINDSLKYTTIHNDKTEALIENFITNYIYKNMTQEQVNRILCQYGIANAMALFHDFHVFGMRSTRRDVCEYFEDPTLKTDYCMVELILLDAVGFHNNWRNNTSQK